MISLDQYSILHERAGVIRRDDLAVIALQGEDRLSYLHGLLTNDIATLTPGHGRYAALLTPQGRMVSDMRVYALPDRVLLELERPVAHAISAHLDTFVIAEDVTVEDWSASVAVVGIYGPAAADALLGALTSLVSEAEVGTSPSLGVLPAHGSGALQLRSGERAYILRADDRGVPGAHVALPGGAADALEAALRAEGATTVTADVLEVARIEAGVPRFLVDMDATTIPLEAGIEERAISMTKGCYVGQEVIVRVLHRGGGRVAKRLVGLRATGPLTRGDRLFDAEREVGIVTSAAESPRMGAPIALGYVQRDFVAAGTELRARGGGGEVPAVVSALPFVIPAASPA